MTSPSQRPSRSASTAEAPRLPGALLLDRRARAAWTGAMTGTRIVNARMPTVQGTGPPPGSWPFTGPSHPRPAASPGGNRWRLRACAMGNTCSECPQRRGIPPARCGGSSRESLTISPQLRQVGHRSVRTPVGTKRRPCRTRHVERAGLHSLQLSRSTTLAAPRPPGLGGLRRTASRAAGVACATAMRLAVCPRPVPPNDYAPFAPRGRPRREDPPALRVGAAKATRAPITRTPQNSRRDLGSCRAQREQISSDMDGEARARRALEQASTRDRNRSPMADRIPNRDNDRKQHTRACSPADVFRRHGESQGARWGRQPVPRRTGRLDRLADRRGVGPNGPRRPRRKPAAPAADRRRAPRWTGPTPPGRSSSEYLRDVRQEYCAKKSWIRCPEPDRHARLSPP